MRITNNIVLNYTKRNINTTKGLTDTYATQMSDKKKIDLPQEDPVLAITSLRLRDSLADTQQYTKKNIPDAQSWLKLTETSLSNMSDVLNDIYKLCVNGSTGSLTTTDRDTIFTNLSSYVQQLYAEGNSAETGRSIFTGYDTDSTLTFLENTEVNYRITQKLTMDNMSKKNFFTNPLTIPEQDEAAILAGYPNPEMTCVTRNKIQLAYTDLNIDPSATPAPEVNMNITIDGTTQSLSDYFNSEGLGELSTITMEDFQNQNFDFASAPQVAGYLIPSTGEIVLSDEAAQKLKDLADAGSEISFDITYEKKNFEAYDVRPEMYFDCTNLDTGMNYVRKDESISFDVSSVIKLKVNTQAGQDGILSTSISNTVKDLLDIVKRAQEANDKVDRLTAMKYSTPYNADDDAMAALETWISAAKNEKTRIEQELQDRFSAGITTFKNYKAEVDLEKTDVGSRGNRLTLTKTRMTAQESTIETLLSENEDRELSDILLDYKQSLEAYEGSLQAASKANSLTLLNYLG